MEARIELEVRNVYTYNTTNPNQRYIIRDILDTVANGVSGVDLIGHQGQKHLAGQPTSRHLNGIFRSFKYNPGVLVSSATLTANYLGTVSYSIHLARNELCSADVAGCWVLCENRLSEIFEFNEVAHPRP